MEFSLNTDQSSLSAGLLEHVSTVPVLNGYIWMQHLPSGQTSHELKLCPVALDHHEVHADEFEKATWHWSEQNTQF